MRISILFYTPIIFLLWLSCSDPATDPKIEPDDLDSILVSTYGDENHFEIATWNLENFPQQGKTTINILSILIQNMDIDLIAVQEVANISAFDSLLAKLPGWQGELSNDEYYGGSYQKTGIVFKSSFISLSSVHSLNISEDTADGYSAFPRPPLAAYVEVRDKSGIAFNFNMIVLHMKAYGDLVSESRRKLACQLLYNYINDEISNGADPDFIVLGDWNDLLEDSNSSNIFIPFLEDNLNRYTFLTGYITDQDSYIFEPYQNLIDHILITQDCLNEYANGETSVLSLDNEYSDYPKTISDHRPVLARFKGIELDLSF